MHLVRADGADAADAEGLDLRQLARVEHEAALLGAGANEWRYAAQTIEAGVFLTTVAAAALIVSTLFGRLPTLRDAEW